MSQLTAKPCSVIPIDSVDVEASNKHRDRIRVLQTNGPSISHSFRNLFVENTTFFPESVQYRVSIE